MAMRSITKRWLLNSMSVVLLILVALVVVFSFGIRTYYYNGVKTAMFSRADVIANMMAKYSNETGGEYSSQVRDFIESFSDRDKMEIMAISNTGAVTITSSGFQPSANMYMPDYELALKSVEKMAYFQGASDSGENILAITIISPIESAECSAVRLATSLTNVNNQIIFWVISVTLICFVILMFVVFTNSYFIRSIVIPIIAVGNTAKKIAEGNFSVRLRKRTDDEIGDLCHTINNMAEELGATEKMKNDFISSVSHELRTPLTAIKGWGETLIDTPATDEQTHQKGMRVILNETERLAQMVEELLDFSRIQSGRLTLSITKIDVTAELSDAVLMFSERAKREEIEIIYDEPDLFTAIMGDKNRLRQVFVNIIDNALKYSEKGGTVTITAFLEDNMYKIKIADTGCGIKAEDLPKIKTKFYKANTTKRGSGIGLAVADEIVRLHGGKVDLDSTENVGTTVTISLPIAK